MMICRLPHLAALLDKHGITLSQLSRSVARSTSGLFNMLERGVAPLDLRSDIEIVLTDAGIKLPRKLWVDSDGNDISVNPRQLKGLFSDDVITALPGTPLNQQRTLNRYHSAVMLDPRKDKQLQPLTLNARKTFGLNFDPFRAELRAVDDVLETREHVEAVEEMLRAAKYQDFIALIGEVGCGKTTCLEIFLSRLPRNVHVIKAHTLDKDQLTGGNLYDAIIMDIAGAMDTRTKLPGQRERKARKVIELLEALEKEDRAAVLILDEAHALNKDCLRALKRLHELDRGFKRLLGIILLGQRELIPKLNDPTLREVGQRCARFIFRGLGKHTPKYIEHKFKRAGSDAAKVFDAAALKEIERVLTHKDGRVALGPYPLQVNTFCTLALNLADELGESRITVEIIDQIKPHKPQA